jgi:hypothetical protein
LYLIQQTFNDLAVIAVLALFRELFQLKKGEKKLDL